MGTRFAAWLVASCTALVLGGSSAAAEPITISLDTSALIGGLTGPYYLDFQLIDGDLAPNTSVEIGNFNFFGGGAVGPATLDGGGSGDLIGGVALVDTSFFNALLQAFLPGTALTFDVTFSSVGSAASPDRFSFAILNSALAGLGTGPADELLSIDFLSSAAINTYAGTDAFGDPLLSEPVVTAAVPEPSTLSLVALGSALVALRRRRHRADRL